MKHSSLMTLAAVSLLAVSGCKAKDATQDATPVAKAPVQASAPVVNVETSAMAELVNPNTATLEQLQSLKGMPETIPALLIEARPFADAKAMDIFLAEHANEPTRDAIYGAMFIPMALNTTPEADFMVIPGVGKKMAHEFEEYRPYTDWDQFNREIGKYVDQKEVARYRRYLTLN